MRMAKFQGWIETQDPGEANNHKMTKKGRGQRAEQRERKAAGGRTERSLLSLSLLSFSFLEQFAMTFHCICH